MNKRNRTMTYLNLRSWPFIPPSLPLSETPSLRFSPRVLSNGRPWGDRLLAGDIDEMTTGLSTRRERGGGVELC